MEKIVILSALFLTVVQSADDSTLFMDVNDFLNEDLMPFSLLLVEGPRNHTQAQSRMDEGIDSATVEEATFANAFSTMGYHRKMINEYLCSNFLADQILTDVVVPNPPKIQRRMSVEPILTKPDAEQSRSYASNHAPKEMMRYDQGSSGYKNWLSKTTSLEDIYRHVAGFSTLPPANSHPTAQTPMSSPKGFQSRKDYSNFMNYEDEYDEGDVTGFAQIKPINELHDISVNSFPVPDIPNYPHPTAGSKFSHDYNAPPPPQSHYPEHEPPIIHYDYQEEKMDKKAIGLKDLFDIALTTLAFLSFGLFVLHLILCLTAVKPPYASMMMPPDGDNGDGGEEELGKGGRFRRSLNGSDYTREMNYVAKLVLRSMDTVMMAEDDDGKCFHRALCEFNKHSRTRKDTLKVWMPVWSLGMSWLSSRMVKPTVSMPILQSLRASAIGLGNGDCKKYFSECKLVKMWSSGSGNT